MVVKYQFNSAKMDEMAFFFEERLGLNVVYTVLNEPPTSGMGKLVHAEIDIKDVGTLLEVIGQKGMREYWSKMPGTIARD